jgi:hypothetical protein
LNPNRPSFYSERDAVHRSCTTTCLYAHPGEDDHDDHDDHEADHDDHEADHDDHEAEHDDHHEDDLCRSFNAIHCATSPSTSIY